MTPDEYIAQLPFALDEFQREAIDTIADGHSVVVCAPTGSGKTVIAEYAATRAMAEGKKLFYTTPLKALSNQKYHDLKARFGEDNVGLLTGDISINRDARLVVMTTEIFRNMLYGVREESRLLGHIGYVVLDECHFMNDAERGTVWEESIIYCPDNIQLIALSATVANARELTDWINEVHHDTRLVWSDFRPVPLRFFYYDREQMQPLFEAPGKMNRRLKLHVRGNRFDKKRRFFTPNQLIQLMAQKDMLPAIFFTFSRKDCDKDLEGTQSLKLLTDEERGRLNRLIDEYVAQNPFLQDSKALPYIRNGFASHHAGLLPALKHLVEQLFQQGLIKAVFATETLAAGINMPARSTVITKISKRTDDGHRILTASEFLQMSGRAGRRGMDSVGYVIIVASQFEGAREAAVLASAPPDPLNSQFTPTYGMVLNLLKKNSLPHAEYLIRQSFGQFTAERRLAPLRQAMAAHEAELNELLNFQCPYGLTDKEFHSYQRSKVLSHETGRFIRILQKQIKQHGESPDMVQQLEHERAKMANLRQTLDGMPCRECKVYKTHENAEDRIRRLQKKLKGLNRESAEEQDTYWRQFMNIYHLLKEAGYLDAADQPTGRGELTAQIRSENEYAMAEVVLHPNILPGLSPAQLAAILCALVNDSNRENLFVHLRWSPEVNQALRQIDKLFRKIDHLQEKHHVDVPLLLNPVASALVEAWAQGMTWERLINSTNIGEGDVVRILRRTADILRQLSRMDLPNKLSDTARTALHLIYREPIKEVEMPEAAEEADPTDEAGLLTLQDVEAEPEPASPATGDGASPSRGKPAQAPDWKPLGTIRDSFTEQMRQDEFFR